MSTFQKTSLKDQDKERKCLMLLGIIIVLNLIFFFLAITFIYLYIKERKLNHINNEKKDIDQYYNSVSFQKCSSNRNNYCYNEKDIRTLSKSDEKGFDKKIVRGYTGPGFIYTSTPKNSDDEIINFIYNPLEFGLIDSIKKFVDDITTKKEDKKKEERRRKRKERGEDDEIDENESEEDREIREEMEAEDEDNEIEFRCIVECRSEVDFHDTQTVSHYFFTKYSWLSYARCKLISKRWDACPEGFESFEAHVIRVRSEEEKIDEDFVTQDNSFFG